MQKSKVGEECGKCYHKGIALQLRSWIYSSCGDPQWPSSDQIHLHSVIDSEVSLWDLFFQGELIEMEGY